MSDPQHGRHGKSGHQNLIRMATHKLINEVIGEEYLEVTLIRENKMTVEAKASIYGNIGSTRLLATKQDMYCDIACAVVYDIGLKKFSNGWTLDEETKLQAERIKEKGDMAAYRDFIRSRTGMMLYIVEAEINPKSNLLRDGPRLTSYKLLKQKNPNLVLILAVFEDCKVDHPELFDDVWRFPKKK